MKPCGPRRHQTEGKINPCLSQAYIDRLQGHRRARLCPRTSHTCPTRQRELDKGEKGSTKKQTDNKVPKSLNILKSQTTKTSDVSSLPPCLPARSWCISLHFSHLCSPFAHPLCTTFNFILPLSHPPLKKDVQAYVPSTKLEPSTRVGVKNCRYSTLPQSTHRSSWPVVRPAPQLQGRAALRTGSRALHRNRPGITTLLPALQQTPLQPVIYQQKNPNPKPSSSLSAEGKLRNTPAHPFCRQVHDVTFMLFT